MEGETLCYCEVLKAEIKELETQIIAIQQEEQRLLNIVQEKRLEYKIIEKIACYDKETKQKIIFEKQNENRVSE